jgi:hypothetical protein
MGAAIAVVALIASLAFNYLQYKWRKEDQGQQRTSRADTQADRIRQETEQRRRERTAPEIYNVGGARNPVRITGSQHSVQGPSMDLWGAITVVNPTQAHMKIEPIRLVINGADWEITRVAFHLKSNDLERYDRISMMGGTKEDYNLHFLFPEKKVPTGLTGDFWLTSSNRADEPFSIPVRFA